MSDGQPRHPGPSAGGVGLEEARHWLSATRAGDFGRQFRRSHSGIDLGDYLIAATADVKGYRLATLYVRHFPMLSDLRPPFAL